MRLQPSIKLPTRMPPVCLPALARRAAPSSAALLPRSGTALLLLQVWCETASRPPPSSSCGFALSLSFRAAYPLLNSMRVPFLYDYLCHLEGRFHSFLSSILCAPSGFHWTVSTADLGTNNQGSLTLTTSEQNLEARRFSFFQLVFRSSAP
jgi:hypothetical protein